MGTGVEHHPCAPRPRSVALADGLLLAVGAVDAEAAESAAAGGVVEAEASLFLGGGGALVGADGRRVLAQQQAAAAPAAGPRPAAPCVARRTWTP
jgi:hypothetical protein